MIVHVVVSLIGKYRKIKDGRHHDALFYSMYRFGPPCIFDITQQNWYLIKPNGCNSEPCVKEVQTTYNNRKHALIPEALPARAITLKRGRRVRILNAGCRSRTRHYISRKCTSSRCSCVCCYVSNNSLCVFELHELKVVFMLLLLNYVEADWRVLA
jgi:hypothetical protein